MKIEIINDEDFDIYVNSYHLQKIEKEKIIENIKDLIIKLDSRYKLNLCGFYKIKAYINKKIGVFLNIIKIDDNEFSNDADFRIIIYPDEKFLLETEDYDILEPNMKKRYYNNKFYIDLDEIKNPIKLMDFGKIIYGDEVKEILSSSKIIK